MECAVDTLINIDRRFVQGSPEWLAYRRTKLGATDYVVLMGKSPYKTVYQLYKEKTGEDVEVGSKAQLFEKAHEIEQDAREYIEAYMRRRYKSFSGLSSDPDDCEASAERLAKPAEDGFSVDLYTRASLDYALKVRLKTVIPVEVKYNKAERHSKLLMDKVDEGHEIQMNIQMYCAGAPYAYYVSFNPNMEDEGSLLIKKVLRNDDLISACLEKGEAFLRNHLLAKIAPEPDELPATTRFLSLEKEYSVADVAKKKAECELKLLKEAMESEADNKAMKGSLYRIKRLYRQGSLDSNAIKRDFRIDLDEYRKKGTWLSTVTKVSTG